jgi:hypothetical protein
MSLNQWFQRNVLDLLRQFRLSYLPPLMVYFAAGVSGLTAVVGSFFVKEVGFTTTFLTSLGFWAGIPWALKMPMGHIVDLYWRWKGAFVFLGASLIAASLGIMYGLIGHRAAMETVMSLHAWYTLAALLAPVGYALQDVVADAMTVEAVPAHDKNGQPIPEADLRLMHTTMQTLGRVAIVGGGLMVAGLAGWLVDTTSPELRQASYLFIYQLAMGIPVVSILGVMLAWALRGFKAATLPAEGTAVNHVLLWGSAGYVAFTIAMGLSGLPFSQEIIFLGSMAIVVFLMLRLVAELNPVARRQLLAIAVLIFVFRAMPGTGPGPGWWQIDVLGFDEHFMGTLGQVGAIFGLLGMFLFRRFMAERPIPYLIGFLTVTGMLLALPVIGMFYGLHEWTQATFGFGARTIALVDEAMADTLGQIAMIPMLAWIAQSAPAKHKATYFAVMASFTNLALQASRLGTKYMTMLYPVSQGRTVDGVAVPADYSNVGTLLITVTVIGFVVPMLVVLWARWRAR